MLNLAWGQRAPLDDVVGHIETTYGSRPRKVENLDTAWRFEIDDADCDWVVRSFPLAVSVESVAADVAALRYLDDCGLHVERPAHPESTSRMATGHTVVVTEFLEGNQPEASERTLGLLGEIAGSLAATPPPAGTSEVRGVAGAYPNYTQPGSIRSELLNARRCLESIANQVPPGLRDLYAMLSHAVAEADDLGRLPTSIVHPDLRLPNIVDDGERLVAFDWQGVGVGPRIAPLGVLLAYEAAIFDEPATGVAAIVESYRSRVQLTRPELERLQASIELRPLVNEAIGLCLGVRLGAEPFSPGDWSTRRAWFAEVYELATTGLSELAPVPTRTTDAPP